MFAKKALLEQAMKDDATKAEEFYQYRNQIIFFVMDRLGPALAARIKTWTVRRYCEEADAQSLVYEHVVMAVDKFKPERGNCKFSSFLWTVSNRDFGNFLNAAKRQKRDPGAVVPIDSTVEPGQIVKKEKYLVSLDETITQSEDYVGEGTLADLIADKQPIDKDLNLSLLVDLIYQYCTDQQKVIVDLIQQEYTYKEIAEHLNSTPAVVSRQIQCLKQKLKRELKNFRDPS